MFKDHNSAASIAYQDRPPATAPSDHSMMGQLAQLRATASTAESLARDLEDIADRLTGGPHPTAAGSTGGDVKRLPPSGFAGGIAEVNEQLTSLFVRINNASQRISHHIG